jgi:hypothetical protein
MLYVRPGATFEAQADNFPTGLVGTLGVAIIDTPTGTVITARTIAGIVEQPAGSGLYSVELVAPAAEGTYSVVWDTGGGAPRYAREELAVTGTGAPAAGVLTGTAYAARVDLANWLLDSDLPMPADAVADRLLEQASRDVDEVLGPLPYRTEEPYAGFKLNPGDLVEIGAKALARATCAQAEHRMRVGRANLGGRPTKREKGPDFEVEYLDVGTGRFSRDLPRELAPLAGLRRLRARARA